MESFVSQGPRCFFGGKSWKPLGLGPGLMPPPKKMAEKHQTLITNHLIGIYVYIYICHSSFRYHTHSTCLKQVLIVPTHQISSQRMLDPRPQSGLFFRLVYPLHSRMLLLWFIDLKLWFIVVHCISIGGMHVVKSSFVTKKLDYLFIFFPFQSWWVDARACMHTCSIPKKTNQSIQPKPLALTFHWHGTISLCLRWCHTQIWTIRVLLQDPTHETRRREKIQAQVVFSKGSHEVDIYNILIYISKII